jgi:heme/copper-type cytochrome/quinol oxidase subunit 1
MLYSLFAIFGLGFFVWAHHMFVVGLDLDSRSYFGCVTLFIGVPTALKLLNWCFSLLLFDLFVVVELLFVWLFILMFLCGGLTGLLLANCGLDCLFHDTFFVVAHFHYALSLGAVVGLFCMWFHFVVFWLPYEFCWFGCGFLFFLFLLGSNFVFVQLHSLVLYAFPRRLSDYCFVYFLVR